MRRAQKAIERRLMRITQRYIKKKNNMDRTTK